MHRLLVLFLLLLLSAVALFFLLRRGGEAAFGPSVALCPGPDRYGYTCEGGTAFAYVDATHDSGLYEDDGGILLQLPFPFTYYGTVYEEVWASSNGNLQFRGRNSAYENLCLGQGPAAAMGDMIAPHWDDLDLRFAGHLDTEVVGQAPNRTFVVEWDDVPPFDAQLEDGLTFAVQFFEGSNDIVFLYPDVATGSGGRGSSATIGLQSAAQGLSLQYGCNQPVLADAAQIRFRHPTDANEEVGLEATSIPTLAAAAPAAKGDVALLLQSVSSRGTQALNQLRSHWLSQIEPRLFSWQWQDLNDDGRAELVALWRGPENRPEDTVLAILAPDTGDQTELLFSAPLAARATNLGRPRLYSVVDVTGEGVDDVVLYDEKTGVTLVATAAAGEWALFRLPPGCPGKIALHDSNGDAVLDVVVGSCQDGTRTSFSWQATQFLPQTAR